MKKKLFSVLVMGFIVFFSKQPLFAITNDSIADTALTHVGNPGDTCKIFVHDVLAELGVTLGTEYRQCYLDLGDEIDEASATRGDIIQISNDISPTDTHHVHTAIVLENYGNGNFETVHSNWCIPPCYNVSTDIWNPSNWASKFSNYSAHFYRLGTVSCRWDFNTTGWDENWTRTRIDDYSVGNGIFYINPGASDPNITSPPIAISAEKSALIICIASNAPDGVGAVYFTTSTLSNWDEAKKVDFTVINDGKYHDYFISMKSNTNWQGTITQIRVDPANKGISYTNIDTIGIDFISLVQLDWNFKNAGNTDGWMMTNIEKYSVGNGIFYIDPGALDPNITSPPIAKNTTEFNSIFIRMANNAPDRVGAIYFTTENFPSWNENKKVPFTVLNDGKYYKYAIHMKSNPNWWGIITGIRIDPANTGIAGTGSDTIGIDCIHLY